MKPKSKKRLTGVRPDRTSVVRNVTGRPRLTTAGFVSAAILGTPSIRVVYALPVCTSGRRRPVLLVCSGPPIPLGTRKTEEAVTTRSDPYRKG